MIRRAWIGAALLIAAGVVIFVLWRSPGRAPVNAGASDVPQAPVTIPEIAARASSSRRVIFLGLDGADWGLLDQYRERGLMPVLDRLVREGRSGTIKTLQPPLSPLIWNTMMTGVSPLEHRILDFLRVNPRTGRREPITSDERNVPAVWNMATYAGRRVGALGFLATYPAEPVNGLLVSDRLFTFLYGETSPPPQAVYPADEERWARQALAQVEREITAADLRRFVPWLDEKEYEQAVAVTDPYSHPVSALRRILIETRVFDRLARDWFKRRNPDLLLVYIQGTDSIGHVFAPYAPPRQPGIAVSEYEKYRQVPERYFVEIDRLLGEYRTLAEASGSVLMLASDHGFAWGEGRPTELSSAAKATAARWHTEDGMYLIWGPGVTAEPAHAGRGTVHQVCATLLALGGVPPAARIAAPPLPGAGEPAGPAVDYRRYFSPPAAVAVPETAARAGEDEETIAKLQALGYIGAAPARGRPVGTRTAGSLNNEGILLKQEGKQQEAIDAFDMALVADPELASAAWNLSDLLYARGALDKSDDLLLRAFRNGLPEGTKFLIGRAIAYQRSGDTGRSLKLLSGATAARDTDPELWLFRGRYRVELGDCAGALEDFNRAIQLKATDASAWASRGMAQLCLGDREGGRRSLERSLTIDSHQPKVRAYLARQPR